MNSKIISILIILILFTLFSPLIFTLKLGLVDFTDTGNIGDTIGGITSPFVGIIGSILVYLALKEQIIANKLIQKQLEDQKKTEYESKILTYLLEQIGIIRSDINNYEFIERSTKVINNESIDTYQSYTGSQAIENYLKLHKRHYKKNGDSLYKDIFQLEQFLLLLELIDNILDKVINENIQEIDKIYLKNLINYIYRSKFAIHLDFFNNGSFENDKIYKKSKEIQNKLL